MAARWCPVGPWKFCKKKLGQEQFVHPPPGEAIGDEGELLEAREAEECGSEGAGEGFGGEGELLEHGVVGGGGGERADEESISLIFGRESSASSSTGSAARAYFAQKSPNVVHLTGPPSLDLLPTLRMGVGCAITAGVFSKNK